MTEHELFVKLTASLKEAESCCQQIGAHRQDQKYGWEAIAQRLAQVRQICYDLAQSKNSGFIS